MTLVCGLDEGGGGGHGGEPVSLTGGVPPTRICRLTRDVGLAQGGWRDQSVQGRRGWTGGRRTGDPLNSFDLIPEKIYF